MVVLNFDWEPFNLMGDPGEAFSTLHLLKKRLDFLDLKREQWIPLFQNNRNSTFIINYKIYFFSFLKKLPTENPKTCRLCQ